MVRAPEESSTSARSASVAEACRLSLSQSLTRLPRLIRSAVQAETPRHKTSDKDPVHQLRVGCRRAGVALAVFADLLPQQACRRARRSLRKVRRSAARLRDIDVVVKAISIDAREFEPEPRLAARALIKLLNSERREAARKFARFVEAYPAARWKKTREKLLHGIDLTKIPEANMGQFAGRTLRSAVRDVMSAAAGDLDQIDRLHDLRLALKRLRYRLGIFSGCLDASTEDRLLQPLRDFQDRLGELSDLAMIVAEFDRQNSENEPDQGPVSQLAVLYRQKLEAAHHQGVLAWEALEKSGYFAEVESTIASLAGRPVVPGEVAVLIEGKFSLRAPQNAPDGTPEALGRNGRAGKRRIAAIDVGTNSLRLIIAETSNHGSYRVLDDEKELTRLGRGLHATGKLEASALAHSVATIAHMKSIADGYGCTQLRVVATAAAREASNADVLVRSVREATGLELEIISAEQEAMLAYTSAANAFDLTSQSALVVDIGGGSTEVVLSVGRDIAASPSVGRVGSGVVEQIYTIPLGAVGLTERFGGSRQAAGRRFEEMRHYIKTVVRQHIGKKGIAVVPQVFIGTGGTFTTLATMARMHTRERPPASLVQESIQGHEVSRAETRHLLEYIRQLSPKDRVKVPGLPGDRADIIVAGITVVDSLLQMVGSNRFRTHEGGIRDGLLLSMVQVSSSSRPSGTVLDEPQDPMRSARRFARACGYEQPHSNHVAKLSLQIFDQMREPMADRLAGIGIDSSRARLILEAAAVLHDVGYLINYNSHHKHSYHLISHAELPGWTAPEVQVIANVARYHRRAIPRKRHEMFAALPADHRQLVQLLAAILRIADGLDRTHRQAIHSVTVNVQKNDVLIRVKADEEPSVDLWGASRKSELFEDVFGNVHLEWNKEPGVTAVHARNSRPKHTIGR